MPDIYNNGLLQSDEWIFISDDDALPVDRKVFVSLQRFLQNTEVLQAKAQSVGVHLQPGDDPEKLKDHLQGVKAIAISFPSFADGRGFSYARILRDTLGFNGEIRATGHFILDQIGLMKRVGFSSFALDNEHLRKDLEAGNLNELSVYTQPVITRDEQQVQGRPWLRRFAAH